jgi:hypothetical protein
VSKHNKAEIEKHDRNVFHALKHKRTDKASKKAQAKAERKEKAAERERQFWIAEYRDRTNVPNK